MATYVTEAVWDLNKYRKGVKQILEGNRKVAESFRTASGSASAAAKGTNKLADSQDRVARGSRKLSGSFDFQNTSLLRLVGTYVTARAAISGLGDSITDLLDFETGLVGVSKTTDLAGADLEAFGQRIEQLSLNIPVGTSRLLELAKTAGQLGVEGAEDILNFAETMGRLEVATDLAGEEGASQLARILNITGEAAGTIDTLGAVIVELGNNFAATESQIARHTIEVARAGAQYGLTSGQAAAIGTTLAAFGVRAELSGSSIQRSFQVIDEAVQTGGDNLERLASISGVTAEEFALAYAGEPVKAFELFVAGLGKIQDESDGALESLHEMSVAGEDVGDTLNALQGEGTSVAAALDELGLRGVRILKTLPVIANQSQELTETLKKQAEQTFKSTALIEESEKAFSTLESELKILSNTIDSAQVGFAEGLEPSIRNMSGTLIALIENNRETIATLGKIGGISFELLINGLGLLLDNGVALSTLLTVLAVSKIPAASTATGLYAAANVSLAAAMAKVNATMLANPIVAMAVAVGAFATVLNGIVNNEIREYERSIQRIIGENREAIESWETFSRAMESADIDVQQAQIDETTESLEENRKKLDGLNRQIKDYERLTKDSVKSGNELKGSTRSLIKATEDLKEQRDELSGTVERERSELERLKVQQEKTREESEKARLESEKARKEEAERIKQAREARELEEQRLDQEEKRQKALKAGQKAIQDVTNEIIKLAETKRIVEEFGVSVEEASKVVGIKFAGDVQKTDEELVELVKTLGDAKEALEDLDVSPEMRIARAKEKILEIQREAVQAGLVLDEALEAELKVSLEKIDEQLEQDAQNRLDDFDLQLSIKPTIQEIKQQISVSTDDEGFGFQFQVESLIAAGEAYEDTLTLTDRAMSFAREHADEMTDGLFMLSDALAQSEPQLAAFADGLGRLLAGDIGGGIGAIAEGLGLTGGGISEFGGAMESNFLAEGAKLGAKFGGPAGALIGAALGSLVSSGADDFHSALTEESDRAVLTIQQAEGGLQEIADQIKQTVEGFLNSLQDSLVGVDLAFDNAQNQIHIREDRIRVVANGIERVFHDLDEAQAFFIQGVLSANAQAEGLGPNLRSLFESLAGPEVVASMEGIQEGIELARKLDFRETGVTGELTAQREKWLAIATKFNLSIEDTIDLLNEEIEARMQAIRVSALTALGARDFTTSAANLVTQMKQMNAEAESESESRQARAALIREELAARREGNSVLGESTGAIQATNEGLSALRDGSLRMGGGLENLNDSVAMGGSRFDDLDREILNVIESTADLEAELEALEDAEVSAQFAADEITAIWNDAAADTGLALIDMIQAIEGPMALIAEQEAFRDLQTIQALAAQIQAAQILLAMADEMSDEARAALEAVISKGEDLLEGILTGAIEIPDAPTRGGGGERRRRREEEARKAEEEARRAAEALDNFNREFERLRLNASTVSGTLGDLNARLIEISQSAVEALEIGADPANVRRRQQILFRQEERAIVEPFVETRRGGLTQDLVDLEKQREDALARARLLAEAQAEELGISFDLIFGRMEHAIENGTNRMERALVAGIVDSFGLPIEDLRKSLIDSKKSFRDLQAAADAGLITQRRYKDLVKQIQQAQESSLLGDLSGAVENLELTEEQAKEVTRIRQSLAEAERQMEIRGFELRIKLLNAEGMITEEAFNDAMLLLEILKSGGEKTAEDLEETLNDAGSRAGAAFSSSFASSATRIGSDLADAIRAFISEFERVGVGPFEQQASRWIEAIEGFNSDIGEALSAVTQSGETASELVRIVAGQQLGLTGTVDEIFAQLAESPESVDAILHWFDQFPNSEAFQQASDAFEAWAAGLGLVGIQARMGDKLLDQYRGTLDATNELQKEYNAINAEFLDITSALNMLGASAAQLAEAEQIRQDRVSEFLDKAFSGVDNLINRIESGDFGGVSQLQMADRAEDAFDDLFSRLKADPLDFEALQQFDKAGEEAIQALQRLTGGAGEEFDRLLGEILTNLQEVRMADIEIPDFETQMQEDQLSEMMAQSMLLSGQNALIEQSNQDSQQFRAEVSSGFDNLNATVEGVTLAVQDLSNLISSRESTPLQAPIV